VLSLARHAILGRAERNASWEGEGEMYILFVLHGQQQGARKDGLYDMV